MHVKSMIKWGVIGALVIITGLIIFAFTRTRNKTELEFLIHINEELVLQSEFGESPTFAIWLEDPRTGETHTVYATRRVATGDWEGKKDVPVALPLWTEINRAEQLKKSKKAETVQDDLIITGATPLPGYFRSRVRITPGSKWICWIEMNLAGDFNEDYPQFNAETMVEDQYRSGQPALLMKAEIESEIGKVVVPEITGMCLIDNEDQVVVKPLSGITTATEVFDKITITVVKPKPRIIEKPIMKILD